MLKELNIRNFQDEISGGLKLVEFYASWCGYCQKEELELSAMDRIWIGQVDVDKEPELVELFQITSFPTFLIFKNGEEAERINGYRKKEDLMSTLMKYMKD